MDYAVGTCLVICVTYVVALFLLLKGDDP